ncbi:MAG: tetratricopeptide repeat protein [Desulfuromonadaceae bacterium]|nr:tetratricopeptide repeat protein [Desulfuromonadaceae bacterium]
MSIKSKRFNMLATVLLFALIISGCGSLMKMASSLPRMDTSIEERNFAGALKYLRSGNESGARDLLERVVDAPPLTGVTDEALFRLSLLSLRNEGGRGDSHARELLDRLLSEFPGSIWAKQGAPLAAYLQEAFALRSGKRQIKNLRNQNLSLSRDNKELRQSMERLKQLDLELEQKIRR